MNLTKVKLVFAYLAGVPKSVYVNFRLFPFSTAIKLPIVVSRKTILSSLSGTASVTKIKPGIIRIGFGTVDMIDYKYHRTILHVTGHISFDGKCNIGKGSRIMVDGELNLGQDFRISADSTIICNKNITIGDFSTIAWETLLMDTDQHAIYDSDGQTINPDEAVSIGNRVWIGARSVILKGSLIANGSIVGANSTITKKYHDEKVIIAGSPTKIIKRDITWQR